MSVDSAVAFLKKSETDEGLRNKVFPLYDFESGQWDGDALVSLGKAEGYDFSTEEIGKASEQTFGEELSDEQLEYVSGGKCCCSSSCSCC